jgi:hypothetical protein
MNWQRKRIELAQVSFCSDKGIHFGSKTYTPDRSTAYCELVLSRAFPVATVDRSALYPQVIQNSYDSMRFKVLNWNHVMRSYNPQENPQDFILGSIIDVEYTGRPGQAVAASQSSAPGIRALALLHKAAFGVPEILTEQMTGQRDWKVSMETRFNKDDSGFLVGKNVGVAYQPEQTPDDLKQLGYDYVSYKNAGPQLLNCVDDECIMRDSWKEADLYFLMGGLSGSVFYQGVGLTTKGKEPGAGVITMAASAMENDFAKKIAGLMGEVCKLAGSSDL